MPLAEYVACLGLRPKFEIGGARRKLRHGIQPHSEALVMAMWTKASGKGSARTNFFMGILQNDLCTTFQVRGPRLRGEAERADKVLYWVAVRHHSF